MVTRNGVQNNQMCNLQVITALEAYQNKTLEELRWEDYQRGKPSSSFGASAGKIAFSIIIYIQNYK